VMNVTKHGASLLGRAQAFVLSPTAAPGARSTEADQRHRLKLSWPRHAGVTGQRKLAGPTDDFSTHGRKCLRESEEIFRATPDYSLFLDEALTLKCCCQRRKYTRNLTLGMLFKTFQVPLKCPAGGAP